MLQALGEAESALRARILGSLARALLYAGLQLQAAVYAEQAVAMARQVSDPAALAFNLDLILDMPWGPEQTEARLTDAMEMLRLSEAAGDTELMGYAYSRLLLFRLELGDIQAADVAITAHNRIAEELRQPFYHYCHKRHTQHLPVWTQQVIDDELSLHRAPQLRTQLVSQA